MGINVEYVGGICSIIVVVIITISISFNIVTWIVKVFILHSNDVKASSTLARALCTELFVITKIMGGDKVNKDVNKEINA